MTKLQRMLIVDDDDMIAVGLADYLKLHGWELDTAHDFETARILVGNRRYALAVVDIMVTGHAAESGMTFLRWLHDSSPETVLVVLTAYRTAWMEHFALSLGVTLFLDKPKSFDEIAGLLSTVLSKSDQVPGESRR
jgi:DNA-binding response OmpR family regulator